MNEPVKQYTAEQIREIHHQEADRLRRRITFNSGTVRGDIRVNISAWPIKHADRTVPTLTYLYRYNPTTDRYTRIEPAP